MKRPPKATTLENYETGYWRIFVKPYGKIFSSLNRPSVMDISWFRGIPTAIEDMTTTDPFGPSTVKLTFPGITLFDEPGEGDLWWLVGEMAVDIAWTSESRHKYTWEGFFSSFDWQETEVGNHLVVSCQGALLALDNVLSKPLYPYQPIPYEHEIANKFLDIPTLRLSPLKVEWPDWWTKIYTKSYWDSKPKFQRPYKMVDGQKWTGLVTRNTGDFTPSLQHIQSLLANMFTSKGQWTLMLDSGRVPVLRHRTRVTTPTPETLVLDLVSPGVKVTSLTRDHTQKVNAVYANGTTIKGVTFNGMRVSPDGSKTWYEPYAARRETHPADSSNIWWHKSIMLRETNIQFAEGASEDEARMVAQQHLERYADPGFTGTVAISVDPEQISVDGVRTTYPRQLIRAGMSLQIKNLLGRPDGIIFHITESTSTDDTTTITIDSKYRDQLTVQEVRARGRDSLAPVRLLSINSYAPTQQDALFPWSYARGSGYIPRGSKSIFDGMPEDTEFPWDDWTRKHPPKSATWRDDYIRIGPADRNADKNWARMKSSNSKDFKPFAVRLSQAGEAKLLQIAAYDRNGNVLPVGFHVSFYTINAVSDKSMPVLAKKHESSFAPYKAGQHYPFFPGAFESVNSSGMVNDNWTNNLQAAGLMAGWGNGYEKAGYWPGSSSAGNKPTGLLSLTNPGFTWNLTGDINRVNVQATPEENLRQDKAGIADVWVMIYCDDQKDQEVFFLGRIFRAEQTAR